MMSWVNEAELSLVDFYYFLTELVNQTVANKNDMIKAQNETLHAIENQS